VPDRVVAAGRPEDQGHILARLGMRRGDCRRDAYPAVQTGTFSLPAGTGCGSAS
jgi:hypothetical protein